ncbi:response regulator [Desulfovibrio cuneatus]|uniref:response regulator n=1 Tax=Desulfovibrio cuneatus TaxID=159728 RepID=UPI000487C935|nr:response regulator [Desulfovibrio cuneatus]
MHILLVDDEADYLELMKNRLEKRGFQVTTAESGLHALAAIEKEAFDVAVLDVKMTGMDGLEVLRRIKATHPEVEVILLSGHASLESAVLGVETGAADYLLKPVPINDLIERLNDVVNKKKPHGVQ